MDDADKAAELAVQMEELRRRATAKPGPEAIGHCLFCEAPLADGVRWCDASCRDDYQRGSL